MARFEERNETRFEHILAHTANGVKTITLNRPEKRNALSPALIDELTGALAEAETSACGVVILTGAGSAFCAGLDMEQMETLTAHTPEEHRRDSEKWPACCAHSTTFPSH